MNKETIKQRIERMYSEEQLKILRNNFTDEQIDRVSKLGAGAVPEEDEDMLLLERAKEILFKQM